MSVYYEIPEHANFGFTGSHIYIQEVKGRGTVGPHTPGSQSTWVRSDDLAMKEIPGHGDFPEACRTVKVYSFSTQMRDA